MSERSESNGGGRLDSQPVSKFDRDGEGHANPRNAAKRWPPLRILALFSNFNGSMNRVQTLAEHCNRNTSRFGSETGPRKSLSVRFDD